MSSTTRLLVLSVVEIFGPVHGYDVRRELLSWGAEQWAKVAPGSIYNALKGLERDGLIEVDGTSRHGGRPARTSYRITGEGRKQAAAMLRDLWWGVAPPTQPLHTAIALLPFLERDEAVAALRSRVKQLEVRREEGRFALRDVGGDPREGGVPDHVGEMLHLSDRLYLAEIEWATELIERLEAGAYDLVGDEPATGA